MKHRKIYAALTRYGFSPQKALEVIVDARRGEKYAIWWVHHCTNAIRGELKSV